MTREALEKLHFLAKEVIRTAPYSSIHTTTKKHLENLEKYVKALDIILR